MLDFLSNHLVALLLVAVVTIYITAYRILVPRKAKSVLREATDYYYEIVRCDPYNDHRWATSPYQGAVNYGGFPGTSAADIYACDPALQGMATGLHDKEFVIPNRDPYPFERVPTVEQHDAANLDIETVDTFVSYTELMGRLRAGTMQLKDMPPTLPVTFEMLLSMVMAMIDTNERKGDAQTCDRVFTLLRGRYDSNSLNAVPEARYLELWVDLKGLERLRG